MRTSHQRGLHTPTACPVLGGIFHLAGRLAGPAAHLAATTACTVLGLGVSGAITAVLEAHVAMFARSRVRLLVGILLKSRGQQGRLARTAQSVNDAPASGCIALPAGSCFESPLVRYPLSTPPHSPRDLMPGSNRRLPQNLRR